MINLSLAGKSLSIEGIMEEKIIRNMREMQPFLTDEGDSDWHIDFNSEIKLPSFSTLHEFDFEGCHLHCRFGQDGPNLLFEMNPEGDKFKFEMVFDGGSSVLATHTEDQNILRYSIWMSVALLGMKDGIMPVHSSVVVHQGKAVLCLGESGTGKSTHTRLWREHIKESNLLNDDSPLLSSDGYIYGSPWSGKTPCYLNRNFPIAAIVRLSQAEKNEIRKLTTLEAIAALQPSLPPSLSHCSWGLDAQLEMISNLFGRVPFYHLACLPNAEAAQLCYKEVFGE